MVNPFVANITILYPPETFSFLVFWGGMKWKHWLASNELNFRVAIWKMLSIPWHLFLNLTITPLSFATQILLVFLTHIFPMLDFYAPLKTSENLCSSVSRRYKNVTLIENVSDRLLLFSHIYHTLQSRALTQHSVIFSGIYKQRCNQNPGKDVTWRALQILLQSSPS